MPSILSFRTLAAAAFVVAGLGAAQAANEDNPLLDVPRPAPATARVAPAGFAPGFEARFTPAHQQNVNGQARKELLQELKGE